MIKAFRHIALGGSTREVTGFARLASHLARVGALFTVLVFFADTINADILYAAIKGDVRFQDNPLILDSATDGTSVVPDIAPPDYFKLAKFDGGAKSVSKTVQYKFPGTTILEDVDSPTVLDGASTQTLTYEALPSYTHETIDETSAITTLDRTITYSRLLI